MDVERGHERSSLLAQLHVLLELRSKARAAVIAEARRQPGSGLALRCS